MSTALKSAAGEPSDASRASVPDRLSLAQPRGALPSASSISELRISAFSPSPSEPLVSLRSAPLDSLSPPQAPATFSGSVAPPRHSTVSLYLVALVAAIVGGGLVLALGWRGSDAARAPAAVQASPVPIAVPVEASAGREPGAVAEFRIVRIESAPPGARVSDRGTEVCLATPCRLVLQGAGSRAEYRLQLTKPGYRPAVLIVRPEDETASAELEAFPAAPRGGPAAGVAAGGRRAAGASATDGAGARRGRRHPRRGGRARRGHGQRSRAPALPPPRQPSPPTPRPARPSPASRPSAAALPPPEPAPAASPALAAPEILRFQEG